MTEAQIKHMVDRFLGWKLPDDFNPDNGIRFKRSWEHCTPYSMPIGTNLFSATQADAMVRYMIEGLPDGLACPSPLVEPGALANRIENDGLLPVATDPDLLVEATEKVIIAALRAAAANG